MDNELNVEKVVNHWLETSEQDFETMIKMFDSKSYNWALFIGHISVEKLLKALFVKKNNKHAPFTHNLYRIAELSKIDMDEEQADLLDEITSFNLNARYDDYKRQFYNLCTKEYTEEWLDKITILRKWIKTQF